MTGAFSALVASMTAIVQADDAALAEAIELCEPRRLVDQAVRHKCGSLLLDGIARSRVRSAAARAIVQPLKAQAQGAVVQNAPVRSQIEEIVGALASARIPHAFLKSGARLRNGDRLATMTCIADLDVLIRSCDAEAAVEALRGVGYVPESHANDGYYGSLHHHLEPLKSPAHPKPVELHVALAKRWHFSVGTTWEALQTYLQTDPKNPYTYELDRIGTTLHLIVHGSGLYRLYDAVLLAAELRVRPAMLHYLARMFEKERVQPIETQATLALAARIAGIAHAESRNVQRLLQWVARREALPLELRRRARFVDAWYGNGSRLRGVSGARLTADLAAVARMIGPLPATTCALGWAVGAVGVASYPARLLR